MDNQKIYITNKKKLLSIVETLKDFLKIILSNKIMVYTNHKNLIQNPLRMNVTIYYDRRWLLKRKERN